MKESSMHPQAGAWGREKLIIREHNENIFSDIIIYDKFI